MLSKPLEIAWADTLRTCAKIANADSSESRVAAVASPHMVEHTLPCFSVSIHVCIYGDMYICVYMDGYVYIYILAYMSSSSWVMLYA